MDWLSLTNIIFTFINLVLICINAYLTHKARTLPYRQMLYSKQLNGYSEVIGALTDLYTDSQVFIAYHGPRLNDRTRPELLENTREKAINFNNKHRKWAVFLPKELNDKLSDYIILFNGISAPPDVAPQFPENIVYTDNPGELLADTYLTVFNTARKLLGVESLSEETLKLVGKVSND